MVDSDPAIIIPPHLTLLSKALQPVLTRVEAQLNALTTADGTDGAEVAFEEFASEALTDLRVFVERLCGEANGALNKVATAEDITEAEVYRAVGRFEMVFDEFLGSYSELRKLRSYPEEPHRLLLAGYRYALQEVQVWLRDLVETVADPMAAMQKRDIPASGDKVTVNLALTFSTPKEMEELNAWIAQQAKAAEEDANRLELEQLNEEIRLGEARIEEEKSIVSFWSLIAGICLGGLFFGDE